MIDKFRTSSLITKETDLRSVSFKIRIFGEQGQNRIKMVGGLSGDNEKDTSCNAIGSAAANRINRQVDEVLKTR